MTRELIFHGTQLIFRLFSLISSVSCNSVSRKYTRVGTCLIGHLRFEIPSTLQLFVKFRAKPYQCCNWEQHASSCLQKLLLFIFVSLSSVGQMGIGSLNRMVTNPNILVADFPRTLQFLSTCSLIRCTTLWIQG
jgi:hypothetical protein